MATSWQRAADFVARMDPMIGLLWVGLATFTVSLIVLTRTRWGRSRPLQKCVMLSLLGHLLLAGYATTVEIVSAQPLPGEVAVEVAFIESPLEDDNPSEQTPSAAQPWEQFPLDSVAQPDPTVPQRELPAAMPEPERIAAAEPISLPGTPSLDEPKPAQPEPPAPAPLPRSDPGERSKPMATIPQIEVPEPQRRETPDVAVPNAPALRPLAADSSAKWSPVRSPMPDVPPALMARISPLPRLADEPTTLQPADRMAGLTDVTSHPLRDRPNTTPNRRRPGALPDDMAYAPRARADATPLEANGTNQSDDAAGTTQTAISITPGSPGRNAAADDEPPDVYKLRTAPDRQQVAQQHGATAASEAAVKAALKWLAANQAADGRWNAAAKGAGRDLMVGGRNRLRAGIEADTGISGLALLAMLAAGHTHQDGPYRENVRRGLQYLLNAQGPDGNLAGNATPFARMYCHSMATFALSEAFAMTGDDRLENSLRRAIKYSVNAQDGTTGGWRYQPGDAGDTSQAGWQLMALKSAELAGIPMTTKTRDGLIRYLQSVASGKHGGLASYRPSEQVSRPMTAEAIVCWQFLGLKREHPAGNEAGDYILGDMPREGKMNLYYWYYATLAMYQLQGAYWERWNAALQPVLVGSQRKTGSLAGSWDPETVWGGYGGRVYSTAMAALSLEVYYRYLPLYKKSTPIAGRHRPMERVR